jgi:hypothetical protein
MAQAAATIRTIIGVVQTGQQVIDFLNTISNAHLNMKFEWPPGQLKMIRLTAKEPSRLYTFMSRAAGVDPGDRPYAVYAKAPPTKFKVIEIVCNNANFFGLMWAKYSGKEEIKQQDVIDDLKYLFQSHGGTVYNTSSLVALLDTYKSSLMNIGTPNFPNFVQYDLCEYKLTYTVD